MRPVYLNTSDASGGEQATPVCPPDIYLNPFNISLRADVTGVATYTVEWTNDDVFDPDFDPATAQWTAVVGMTDAVADANATLISPVRGIRMRQTAGAGSVNLAIVQSGATS
jgi:hypothetical protein